MSEPDTQRLVAELQQALGLRVRCGVIMLNVNEGVLQSVKVETYLRIRKSVDKSVSSARNT